MKYVIATHNALKLIELQRILEPLGIQAVTDRDLGLELPEVEETGTTFAENAYLKAASACEVTGLPAIADDSGLVVDALDGRPGVYSARYGGEEATDDDRNVLLLGEMKDVPDVWKQEAVRNNRYDRCRNGHRRNDGRRHHRIIPPVFPFSQSASQYDNHASEYDSERTCRS